MVSTLRRHIQCHKCAEVALVQRKIHTQLVLLSHTKQRRAMIKLEFEETCEKDIGGGSFF